MIAEVAELVDALGSGSSRWTPVGVRVPSSAPKNQKAGRFSKPARFFSKGVYYSPQARTL